MVVASVAVAAVVALKAEEEDSRGEGLEATITSSPPFCLVTVDDFDDDNNVVVDVGLVLFSPACP